MLGGVWHRIAQPCHARTRAALCSTVDIWGYVSQGLQGCFDTGGSLLFLDSAAAPRQNSMLTTTAAQNFRSAQIGNRIGWVPQSVILMFLDRRAGWFKVDCYGAQG